MNSHCVFAGLLKAMKKLTHPDGNQRFRCSTTACTVLMRSGFLFLLLLTMSAGSTAQQTNVPDPIDENVNTLCTSALELGALSLPYTRDDSLENDSPEQRIDFFRFDTTPAIELAVSMQGQSSASGTLEDPYLGWFNSNCQLLAINDDARTLDSYLIVTVPDDGVLVLAASSCCDNWFSGEYNIQPGSYRLAIDNPPIGIGSINLQINNALTMEPIRGDVAPYAYAELYRCGADCDEYINSLNADDEGRVSFNGNDYSPPLAEGVYLLRVRAENFSNGESGRFSVAANGITTVTVPLTPPPISLGRQMPCENLPPQGGFCYYTVVLNNNTDRTLNALMWSQVDGYDLGSPRGYTRFEASTGGVDSEHVSRSVQTVPPFSESAEIIFGFEVPAFVPQGAQFCQYLYIGLDPNPLMNVITEQPLFCIQKMPNSFSTFKGTSMAKAQYRGNNVLVKQRLRSQGLFDLK